MIITIDGPAGAGKSSAARGLASRLGFDYLDTGAMFRCVALAGLRGGIDLSDEAALEALVRELHIEVAPGVIRLNGEDVSGAIRTSEVTQASGPVASSPSARRFLAAQQRRVAEGQDMVCEGRDQGTVVFPDAACKFFLFADPRERARRRQRELVARGESITLEEVLAAQNERDHRDASRSLAPMAPAADAVQIDSTHLPLEAVVDRMEQEVRRCRNG